MLQMIVMNNPVSSLEEDNDRPKIGSGASSISFEFRV